MGRAEDLFNRVRDNGVAEVYRMISEPVVEELFLDYKQSSTTLPSRKLSDEDKKNLAKAIAGFANSEGGLIVWGVDCRHTKHGDVPTGIRGQVR
jgi:Putative DNA-binding domain